MNQWRQGRIQIGTITDASNAYFGHNVAVCQTTSRKVSDGFGSVRGQGNAFFENVQITLDNDVIDSEHSKGHSQSDKEL
ncbi:hypothetical protein [Alicyclobacillus acidoterrestris]|uniref:Uncharacterized protein n=1 Tax=Alicyclobacillus acidoterrestris (strain ATCC 49025 / DSM 3922 / CIP 106132 / NCIMB 13137 / GD3B) TaxID=1356854 RepID=T0CNU7_ALIAG|nr:hypothetical protein [Alicyclobacillus acidoterrestris]EPZ41137.1 hypothetical protein N007_17370 [Alicyclobacillus acidoterrestris ATCC 49025]UNO47261.1 hypothetical protein K1I37_10975 [Alicyclobacillus acidoterrestris]